MSIRGLTTAASIWAASAIGVLLGVGFYATALMLAVLCMTSMSLLHRLESKLPGRTNLDVSLTFNPGEAPDFDLLATKASARGYCVLHNSLTITFADKGRVARGLVAPYKARAASPAALAAEMATTQGVACFSIMPVRS